MNILMITFTNMIKIIIISLLIVLSLFIGFYPHQSDSLNISTIMPFIHKNWYIQCILSVILFTLAIIISQSLFLENLTFFALPYKVDTREVTQNY